MAFHAAKDLVYTINGNNISSGGYRINKILNGKSKKKGKNIQTQEGGGGLNIFNEDSGIPVGLLLLQNLHHYDRQHDNGHGHGHGHIHKNNDKNSEPNQKLVYASIMTDYDDDNDNNDGGENIELVIMPSGVGVISANEYSENPIEISSNEIEDELYDSLIKSVSRLEPESVTIKEIMPLPLRKTSTTKKQHFGKHIEKIFQKRKTRSKRRN